MDNFASETDSDYTSYWRDWVSLVFFLSICFSRFSIQGEQSVILKTCMSHPGVGAERLAANFPPGIVKWHDIYLAPIRYLLGCLHTVLKTRLTKGVTARI